MSVNNVGGSPGLHVSPYLASALSRMQANGLAARSARQPSSKAPNAAQAGSTDAANQTRVLSHQTIGALVAIQMDEGTPPPVASNPAEDNSGS